MNQDDFEMDIRKFELIDGSYQGDILKGTRIQHGRGIFIEKNNYSVYEGWRFKNKREIYGRLINEKGVIYEGEFKNNMPHGKGKLTQIDSIDRIYPKGFEFIGNFKNGMREQWGVMTIPSEQDNFLQYIGYFKNNQMDGIFTVKNKEGDQWLESYEKDYILRKFNAYVFTHKSNQMYGYIPHVQGKQLSLMSRVAFNSVRKLKNLENLEFKIIDIDQRNLTLQEYQLSTLWLKYQADNKQNDLIQELLQGLHPQVESIFEDVLNRVREKFKIEKNLIQQDFQSEFGYSMVVFKQEAKTISILHEDDSLVVKIMSNIWQELNGLLQESQIDNEENSSPQKLSSNLSTESETSNRSKKNKLPNQDQANEIYKQLNEIEKQTEDIQEFINLARLVEEQDFKTGQIYKVKTKQDLIQSLLNNDPRKNIHKYRIILGRILLQMCVSMHFVGNPAKGCIENFLEEQNILLLYENSQYRDIAFACQKINQAINLKNTKHLDQDGKISPEHNSELIPQITQNMDSQNSEQEQVIDKKEVDVFFNFLGAIAHLLEPEQSVKFVLDILLKHASYQNSKELQMKKMEKIYKLRNIKELETHVGYQFNDKLILVQSLTHERQPVLKNQQSSLENLGELVLKFILLRENLLKNDLKNIEIVFNSEINLFENVQPEKISVLSTLLGLHSKVFYPNSKETFNSNNEYFEEIIKIFQMDNKVTINNSDYNQMLKFSLRKLKLFDNKKEDNQFISLMKQTFYAFIGAINLDSNLNQKTYKSFVTLLPYIFIDIQCLDLLKQECVAILKGKTDIINFPQIFRVSKEWFQATTQSMKCNFNDQGKLFDIKEFDIYSNNSLEAQEDINKLSAYIKELENKYKHKLVNIIFHDEDENFCAQTTYHIVHSHVLSICLRKEEDMKKEGLLKKFLAKIRESAKQRIINEKQMLMMTKQDGNGLTLAQKIKILINLNSVQYLKIKNDIDKTNQPPNVQDAMNYINKLKVKKEKTYDSVIYTYDFQQNDQGVEKDNNPLKSVKQTGLHFIKQPILYRYDGEGDTSEIIKKNQQYILNNILENQLIQLSHFLRNQESDKLNELIILDEYQLRVVDYIALREDSINIQELTCPIEKLSLSFQIFSIATESLHEFDVFNGNIKQERIKLNPFGYNGFFYNGNSTILYLDNLVQKNIIDIAVYEEIKNQKVDEIQLYDVSKFTPGCGSQHFIQAQEQNKKLSKSFIYQEEAYQIVSAMNCFIRSKFNKNDQNLTSDQKLAKTILLKIKKICDDLIPIMKKDQGCKLTIYDFQQQLRKDLTISFESIRLFRANLQPAFSRNLWIYLDHVSPIHPMLLQLVFPWKYFNKQFIDPNDFSEKDINQDQISIAQTQSYSHEQDKINMLRELHISFIEDWWFEIAKLMNKSKDLHNNIDSQELEYVKSMVTSDGQRVKFDWLSAKVRIIKYFKTVARRQQQPQGEASATKESLEESKKEEEKKEGDEDPEVILEDVKSIIKEIAEAEFKEKPRKITMEIIQNLSSSSSPTEEGEVKYQDQLRHFVNAAIYSLKDVHSKIYNKYGPQCLKEYIKIIIEALGWIKSDSFFAKMLKAFLAVKEQSQFISEDFLNEIILPSEKTE